MGFKILFVLIAFLFLSCENKTTHKATEIEVVNEDVLDEDFYEFIEKFNTDKTFQLSRIHFPYFSEFLDYDENNEDHVMNLNLISETEHQHLDLGDIKDKYSENQEHTVQVEFYKDINSAAIIYKGIDNGIYVQFNFSQKDSKWYFMGVSDSSM
jgi:hypothetical protein